MWVEVRMSYQIYNSEYAIETDLEETDLKSIQPNYSVVLKKHREI